jgi:biopolymer transport protein ExbD
MTPMIDVVFQMLTFFIFTFRVVQVEGDFNIRMPASQASAKPLEDAETTTIKIRMRAQENGDLASLSYNAKQLTPTTGSLFDELHLRIREEYSDGSGPNAKAGTTEAEFECDYNLKYVNVINAITAISGFKLGSGDDAKVVRLIEKIKFAPAKGKPAKSG